MHPYNKQPLDDISYLNNKKQQEEADFGDGNFDNLV